MCIGVVGARHQAPFCFLACGRLSERPRALVFMESEGESVYVLGISISSPAQLPSSRGAGMGSRGDLLTVRLGCCQSLCVLCVCTKICAWSYTPKLGLGGPQGMGGAPTYCCLISEFRKLWRVSGGVH